MWDDRHQSPSEGGRGVSAGAGADGTAGGARSGDEGGLGRREGRTGGGPTGLSVRLLRLEVDRAVRQAGAAGTAGSKRAILDRAVRTVSAVRASAGGGTGGDVRARGFDPQGESDHRGAVRPQLLGFLDQCDEPAAGCEPGAICRPPFGRSLPLSDPRRALRAGARGRRDHQPGGADRDRHRLGRPPPNTGGRARQPREPGELARFPARAGRPWSACRRICRARRSCGPAGSTARGSRGGGLSALLRAFPAQRARSRAAQEPALAKAGVDDDGLQELRWLYDRRDLTQARRDLAARLAKWSCKYSKLTGWVEDNIDETPTPAFAGAGSFTGCHGSTIQLSIDQPAGPPQRGKQ